MAHINFIVLTFVDINILQGRGGGGIFIVMAVMLDTMAF